MNAPDNNFLLDPAILRFRRDSEGNVILLRGQDSCLVGSVTAVFPLTDPNSLVSLRDPDGNEIGIIDGATKLDHDSRKIVRQELDRSYFMPQITDIHEIDEQHNLVLWRVETNRGLRDFYVRHLRQNMRRIGLRRHVVKDVDGNRYEIADWATLPTGAQHILEPYI